MGGCSYAMVSAHMTPTKPLHRTEFIALMAMLAATVAFSVDAMLPALPEIGAELSPDNLNNAQLIITAFVLGMGLGTFFAGPLSDRFGRKPVVAYGAVIYIVGAGLAYFAQTLEPVLAARLLQGLGAAGPRVVSMAMIRDLHAGRGMAQILSFVMMVFTVVPALAPTMSVGIIAVFGWRGVFLAFIAFSLISLVWLTFRQPETLAPQNRRPLQFGPLKEAILEVLRHPTTRLSLMIQTLVFSMLFLVISSTQQVFDITYGWGDSFHLWFGGIAVLAASASVVNAFFVVRVGMRAIIKVTLAVQVLLSVVMVAAILAPLSQPVEFAIYVLWTLSLFYQAGLCIGNLNALALEPMGHIAGMAASVVAALSTVGAVIIAAPVGLMFNRTALPMAVASILCAALGLWLTTMIVRDTDAA